MNMRNFGMVLACALLAANQAQAQSFYGVTADGSLTRFDMAAHTVTTIGNIHAGPNSPSGFTDLEFDASGNLYALRAFSSNDFPPTTFNEVYRITNPATASAVLSTSLSGSTPLISLAYNGSNSTFYSVNGFNGFLGTVGVTTGAFGPVSGVYNGTSTSVQALAVNPVNGLAYGIVNQGSAPPFGSLDYALISMNLTTGVGTIVGSLGVGQDQFRSLRFDDAGVAYTVDSDNGNVYTVNLGTGHATFLFAGGAAAMNTTGLAFAVPAPGVGGLMSVAGVLCLRRRRR